MAKYIFLKGGLIIVSGEKITQDNIESKPKKLIDRLLKLNLIEKKSKKKNDE